MCKCIDVTILCILHCVTSVSINCVYLWTCVLNIFILECIYTQVCVKILYLLTASAALPVCVSDVQQLSDSFVHRLCEPTVVFTPVFTTHIVTHTVTQTLIHTFTHKKQTFKHLKSGEWPFKNRCSYPQPTRGGNEYISTLNSVYIINFLIG